MPTIVEKQQSEDDEIIVLHPNTINLKYNNYMAQMQEAEDDEIIVLQPNTINLKYNNYIAQQRGQ